MDFISLSRQIAGMSLASVGGSIANLSKEEWDHWQEVYKDPAKARAGEDAKEIATIVRSVLIYTLMNAAGTVLQLPKF